MRAATSGLLRIGVPWHQPAALPPLAQEFRDLAVAWCAEREF